MFYFNSIRQWTLSKDKTFGYSASTMPEYVEENTGGLKQKTLYVSPFMDIDKNQGIDHGCEGLQQSHRKCSRLCWCKDILCWTQILHEVRQGVHVPYGIGHRIDIWRSYRPTSPHKRENIKNYK